MIKHILAGSGLSFVITLGTLMFLARGFSLEFVATVRELGLYSGWFAVVFTFQIQAALLYYNRSGSQSRLQTRATRMLALSACLAAAVFSLFVPIIVSDREISRTTFLAFAVFTGCAVLINATAAVYASAEDSRVIPRTQSAFNLCSLIGLLVSWFMNFDVESYAIVLMLLALTAILTSKWPKYLFNHSNDERQALPDGFFFYALRLNVSSAFEVFGDRLDKLVASRWLSAEHFAKYSLLCMENPVLGMFLNATGIAVIKRFNVGVLDSVDEFYRFWARSARLTTIVVFPISLFCLFNPSPVIIVLFGESFTEYSAVFQIYMAVSLIRYAPFQSLLRMEGLVQLNVVIAILFCIAAAVSAGIVIVADLPRWLIAASYLAGWLLFNMSAICLFKLKTGVNLQKLINPTIWIRTVLLCCLSQAVTWSFQPPTILGLCLVFFSFYSTLTFVFDTETRADVYAFTNHLLKKTRP